MNRPSQRAQKLPPEASLRPSLAPCADRRSACRAGARPEHPGATHSEPRLRGERAWRGLRGRTLDRSARCGTSRRAPDGGSLHHHILPQEPPQRTPITTVAHGSEDSRSSVLQRHGKRRAPLHAAHPTLLLNLSDFRGSECLDARGTTHLKLRDPLEGRATGIRQTSLNLCGHRGRRSDTQSEKQKGQKSGLHLSPLVA